jgi:hypothetical protein
MRHTAAFLVGAKRDRRTRAGQREVVAVKRAQPEVIEFAVVELHQPLAAGVVLPDPFGKPVLDLLLFVAGGLGGGHVDPSALPSSS